MFSIGDIIKRNPNKDVMDPPYDKFKNGNDIFIVIDIIKRYNTSIYCIKSLNTPDIFYSNLYNRNKLWSKIA